MQVKVDDVETPLLINSLKVGRDVGQRSTGGVMLKDADGSNHYEFGQRVDIYDDDSNLAYSGVVDTDDESMPDDAISSGLLYHNLALIDWHYLADKRLVATTYESGKTCGFILRDLITNYLAEEGVYSVLNLLSANQSNVETDTTGFTANNSATLTRDTTEHWQGSASLKCVTGNAGNGEGWKAAISTASDFQAGKDYTFSVYLKGSGDISVAAQRRDTSALLEESVVTLTSTWTRYSVTATIPDPAPTTGMALRVVTNGQQSVTFYADGLQVEAQPTASDWEEGGTDTIADGPTLPDVVFNYASAAACADAITQKAGNYWWQIDLKRRFWFKAYATVPAPWSLTADANNVVTDARRGTVKVKRNKPKYRNRQIITNVTGLTDSQVETRKGDGTATAFTMNYPLAKVPTITLNAGSQTVGILGVDTGKNWYWNAGSNVISQDTSGTKITSSDTLSVTYVGQYPLIVISKDDAEIAAQQTLEGGSTSGKVEEVESGANLTTSDAAFAEAAALLAKYTQKAKTLRYMTRRSGLAPGQLQGVTIPQHGFDAEQFLITSVNISDEDGQIIWYDVTALQGPVDTTWEKFFGVLATQSSSESINVGSSSTLVTEEDFSGGVTASGTLTATVYACPLLGTSVFPLTLC